MDEKPQQVDRWEKRRNSVIGGINEKIHSFVIGVLYVGSFE